LLSGNPLVCQLLNLTLGHFSFLRFESEGLNEVKVRVTGEGSEDPEERLLVLVVRLGRDIEVLEIALSVESDLAGLDFSVLLVNLISDENNGDVVANSGEILVPLGHIFVGNSGGDVEHHDGGVGTNVVAFS